MSEGTQEDKNEQADAAATESESSEAAAPDANDVAPAAAEPTAPAESDATSAGPSVLARALKLLLIMGAALALAAVIAYGYNLWRESLTSDTPVRTTQSGGQTAQSSARPANAIAEDIIPTANAADIDALNQRIDALSEQLSGVSIAAGTTEQTLAAQSLAMEKLRSGEGTRADLLESLPGRVSNVEESIAALKGISTGSRKTWLLAEAEYYMQIANAQVQLANNPKLGAVALDLADQRVRQLADPAYTEVRRALASEIAALNSITRADIEGITLTLGSLAAMVPSLQMINEISVPDAGQVADDSLTGMARVRGAMSSALGGLVRIREADEQVKAMLSPEAEYFLRLNLQLQLQAARLSLLLGETASFKQSLDDTRDWLRDYFDTDTQAVKAAQGMLDSIAETQFNNERPDVSTSLRLLRQQKSVEASIE